MQSVEVSEGPSRATRFLKLHACDVAEFNLAPHDMSQTFFECLCSVECGGSTICQHFLQSRCAMADTPEEEVIEPQELESDVPKHGLASVGHGVREVHHVLVDPQSYVAACCITMRKVSVLMSENRAKGILTEARKKSEAHPQRALPFILAALATRALFVDRHLGSGSDANLVQRTRAQFVGDLTRHVPQVRSVFPPQCASRLRRIHANKESLHHLVDRHYGSNHKNGHKFDRNEANHQNAIDNSRGHTQNHHDHDGQRDVVVRARDIDELPVTTAQ